MNMNENGNENFMERTHFFILWNHSPKTNTMINTTLPAIRCAIYSALASIIFACSCTKEKNNNTDVIKKSSEITSDASLQTSLVAWYTFNGNTLDSSGYNNNVVFNNCTAVPDRFGNPNGAYLFDGISNYMRVANSPSLNPSGHITLFAIVKVNSFYQGLCHSNRILNKSYDDNSQGDYYLAFDDAYSYNWDHCDKRVRNNFENFNANYGDGQFASTGGVDTSDFINKDQWYDIAFTYDGDTAKFYVDGRLKYTNIGAYPFHANSYDLFFGTTNPDNTKFPYWFNGVIDEIRIYRQALTANQVRKLNQYAKGTLVE